MSALLPVSAALGEILKRIEPLPAERVPIAEAVDRVLAEPVVAGRALPADDDSAMDGYAVRAADVPAPGVTLRVEGEVRAGEAGEAPLAPGTARRIFTGAPLPPGADAVIMQEDARRDGEHVTFTEGAAPGKHVRRRGSDVEPGRLLLEPGRALRPGDVGLLATLGRGWVSVVRRPVVALAASGDELVEPDAEPPRRGQVVNGNLYGLAAAVRALGAVPRLLPLIPDDEQATRRALAEAAEADALLTTGGMSVGEYDFVRDALRALSGDRFGFWKVAIRPGKPIGFGHIGRCAVFGLPGNPVSALVTFEVFVRPALLRLMGHARVRRAPVPVVLDAPLRAGGDREEYLRAALRRVDGRLHADTARAQGSGALSSIAGADALVVVPPGAPARVAGELAEALPLGPDDPATRLA